MNLKLARIQSGKTQVEIASDLGIAQNTYSNYENEKTQPRIEDLIAIADYHNVSLDYLCGRQWNNNVGYIPEDRKDFVKQILELDDIDIEKAKAYVTALKDTRKG